MMNKKKVLSVLLTAALAAGCMIGCGNSGSSDSDSGNSGSADATEDGVISLDFWTFTEIHGEFYETMAELWNEENPDRQVSINVNVMPYEEMHNTLQIALNSGEGTPDFVDIEQGRFANFVQGTPALMDLTEVADPYTSTGNIIQPRLDLYSKDGALYGLPTHVGATVAFYNTTLLEDAGIDYTTIVTWDDFRDAGSRYYEATGRYLGTADTGALWTENLILAELGGEYTDENDNVTVNSPEMIETMTILKDLYDANAIGTVPGGNPDTEEAYGAFNNGDFACAIMPMWQMSRYLNYMPDLAGQIAIAPAPVVEEGGDVLSVGGGETGTAVVADKENSDLAAEFLAYAKLSDAGNGQIWTLLGFDPCNTVVWDNEEITNDPDNAYIQYFQNNPFDVLREIRDGIAGLDSHASSSYPSVNTQFTTVTLNEIFENGTDVQTALDQAQADLQNELGQ